MISKHTFRKVAAAFALFALAALTVCGMPGTARAETDVPDGANLADYIGLDNSLVIKSGAVAGCDVPAGVSVTITGGTLNMDGCLNAGTLSVNGGALTGKIYNTGSISGGSGYSVRVKGPAVSGVSEVRYASGSESPDYKDNCIWIPQGETVLHLVIGEYLCTPSGGRYAYSITYKYNNSNQSAMQLDTKKYPTQYYVKVVEQVIPAAPDTEIDYVFRGWHCAALGYDENNLQSALAIPAEIGGNLTLLSWWTDSPGHNEGKTGASAGMSAGGGTAGGISAGGGLSGAIAELLPAETTEEDDEADTQDAIIDYSTGAQGGVRVRNANATTRHSFSDAADDIEARASMRQQKHFPWQWVGVGLGGALILLSITLTVRRRLRERNEATLRKLHIKD